MSQDFVDEDWEQMSAWHNEEMKVSIGKVKDVNDYTNNTEMGVSSTLLYKKPLQYNSKEWENVRIISYIIDKDSARTNVWGRPVKGGCLDEILFEDLSKEHIPSELPLVHSETVEEIRNHHLNLFREGRYSNK